MKNTKPKIISIVGTNASGKSTLGFELAKILNAEIVSSDSRQVYKHLNLVTGKVTEEEMAEVKHHLIDILELNEQFSLADYQKLAYNAIDDILSRGKLPILVGGTGLYTRAVVEGYGLTEVAPNWELREELESKTDEELLEILKALSVSELPKEINRRRIIRQIEMLKSDAKLNIKNKPRYNVLQIGIERERDEIRERIKLRLDKRLEEGMLNEVKNVIEMGATPKFLEGLGLDVKCCYKYLTGGYSSYDEFYNDFFTKDCQYAKRQRTWLRRDTETVWLNSKGDYFNEAKKLIKEFLI